MIILDGKKLADRILDNLRQEVSDLPASPAGGPPIKLAVILVGDDSKSLIFVKQKQKATEKIGIGFELYKFDKNISEEQLAEEIKKIITDKTNTGIIIQLPIPLHINTQTILNLIPPEKDAEFESPTVSGIMKLLEEYNIDVKGKTTVIVGKGRLVGQPLSIIMEKAGAQVIVCDSDTKNLNQEIFKADILVSATGQPHLIKESMVKQGVVIIDAGTGDVDFENIKKKASHITPPVGGVGPMTVAILIDNLIKLARKT